MRHFSTLIGKQPTLS
uniref:Uncharacterized protein n=1 Tax=Rhizophora mucronata TaxID=61149 RepID=A0A2P2QLU0_RHIMU